LARLTLRELEAASPRAREAYRKVAERARTSYFLSPAFVELFLDSLPPRDQPRLCLVERSGVAVAAFFLARRQLFRHRILPSHAAFLNVTGDPRYDEITLEDNSVVRTEDARLELESFVELLPDGWDELFLPALDTAAFPGNALGQRLARATVLVEREVPAPYVDLSKVRGAPAGYPALLGKNTRAELRRAERAYGELEVEVATSREHALEIFAELVELHQADWRARGAPGAFADPWFSGFHSRLVEARWPAGEVSLLRLRGGGKTVGCLYDFVWNGRVLYYQSGFVRSEDPRAKPGFVCHAAAIRRAAAEGRVSYEFLAGSSRYKRSLATDTRSLVWARVQRPRLRFTIEQRLRDARAAWLAR